MEGRGDVLEFGAGTKSNMPIYEYRCGGCNRRVEFASGRGFVDPPSKACPECGSGELSRLISRVAILKSDESRLEELSDPSSWGGSDDKDPKVMADMMRQMEDSMGEEMGPEFGEIVDRMESGDLPGRAGRRRRFRLICRSMNTDAQIVTGRRASSCAA